MRYKDFYSYLIEQTIVEGPFSKSKNLNKILSTRMFTVYEKVGDNTYENKKTWWVDKLRSIIPNAEKKIDQLIGKTMHVNVLIIKGKGQDNHHYPNDGKHKSTAYAKPNSYIGINETLFEEKKERIEFVLFHEYMHMVLFNKSKKLKNTLTQILYTIRDDNIKNIPPTDINLNNGNKKADTVIKKFSDQFSDFDSILKSTSKDLNEINRLEVNLYYWIETVLEKYGLYSSVGDIVINSVKKQIEKLKSLNSSEFEDINHKDGYDYLWVYNEFKPKAFSLSDAVKKDAIFYASYSKSDITDKVSIRKAISKMLKYVSDYGLADKDELWVNFFENLKKLPKEYRRIILDAL
jgi:hypothetical protein